MGRRHTLRLCAGMVIALATAACGGGRATAPDTGSGPPLTVATAGATTGEAVTAPPFPATTASGVIQLASQRPSGVETYEVTVHGDAGDLAYQLQIASNGQRARLHQTQSTGEVWVGLNVATRAVTYFCTAAPGEAPACQAGDPDGLGAQTAEAIAKLLGNDVLQATFGAAAAAAGTSVGPDVQLGAPVSCMAASSPDGDLRLCSTADGRITELTAAGTKALATAVTPDVTEADLDAPVS